MLGNRTFIEEISEEGIIENLTLECNIVAGDASGVCTFNNGTLNNIKVVGSIKGSSCASSFCHINSGIIKNSFSSANLTAVHANGIGWVMNGQVDSCEFSGIINEDSSNRIRHRRGRLGRSQKLFNSL